MRVGCGLVLYAPVLECHALLLQATCPGSLRIEPLRSELLLYSWRSPSGPYTPRPTPGDVPKLAASSGACAASLPVPISLKGLKELGGHNILASRWHIREAMQWPSVPWHLKRRRAVWRGQFRSYSECLGVRPVSGVGVGGGGGGSCALRTCESSCYGAPASHTAKLLLELSRSACAGCACEDGAPPHPRAIAVRLGRSGLPLDASFTPCNPAHGDCLVADAHAAAQSAAQRRLGRLPFAQQATHTATSSSTYGYSL